MGNVLTLSTPGTVDELKEAETLRHQASQLFLEAKSLSAASQDAYQRGDKSLAKTLSDKKKSTLTKAEHVQKQARNVILHYYNKDRGMAELDLHGLHVKEALEIVQDRLKDVWKLYQENQVISTLLIITGQGNHSQNNLAKIKPEIIQLAKEQGLQFNVDVPNRGVKIRMTSTSKALVNSSQYLRANRVHIRPVKLSADGCDYSDLPSILAQTAAALSLVERQQSTPYLPNEIIHHIVKFIPTFSQLASLRLVNTRFRSIVEVILMKHYSVKASLLEIQLQDIKTKYSTVEKTLAPHLTHYKQFLRNISTQEIVEATWYSTPPVELHSVCACLCILKKDPSPELAIRPPNAPEDVADATRYFDPTVSPMTWAEVKRVMTRYDFKTWLTNLHTHVETIPIANIRKVEQIIQHDATITYERLREVSMAGYKLLILVAACLQYGSISEEVKVEKRKWVQVETELRGVNIFVDFLRNPVQPALEKSAHRLSGKGKSLDSKKTPRLSGYRTVTPSPNGSGASTPIVRGSRSSLTTRVNSTRTSRASTPSGSARNSTTSSRTDL